MAPETIAVIVLAAIAAVIGAWYLILRENLKDRKKRSLQLPPDYYKKAPPPLPPQRTKGPPGLGRRG